MIESESEFKSPEETQIVQGPELQEEQTSVEKERRRPFDAVIVLGCGLDDPLWKKFKEKYPEGESPRGVKIEKSQGWMLGPDARMRTIAAAEMLRQGLTSQIIFTGGRTGEKRDIGESEAQKMKEYAHHLLGVGGEEGMSEDEFERTVILEDKATNTIENIANVCNIIDQQPDQYQNLAILTNDYHLKRAQELIGKFNLQAGGFKAEDLMTQRSPKYTKVVNNFFNSPGYKDRMAGEIRWTKGLREMPQYWHPLALKVENPARIDYILKSLGMEQIAEKVGKEALVEYLRNTTRKMPPPEWGEKQPHKIKINLIRHGESLHNVAEVPYFAGSSKEHDVGLTEKGIESAKQLAKELKDGEKVDVIIHSDLVRSHQTAEIIAQELGYPVELVEMSGLREVDVGELSGKTWEQVKTEGSPDAQKALENILSGDVKRLKYPGGEDYEGACQRVQSALNQIIKSHGDKTKIVIVGHYGSNKVALSLMFPDEIGFVNQLPFPHTAIVEFEAQIDNTGHPIFRDMTILGKKEGER